MRLESVAKFHSPKSPMMSDSPRATASDSLSGTDVMAAMGMTGVGSIQGERCCPHKVML